MGRGRERAPHGRSTSRPATPASAPDPAPVRPRPRRRPSRCRRGRRGRGGRPHRQGGRGRPPPPAARRRGRSHRFSAARGRARTPRRPGLLTVTGVRRTPARVDGAGTCPPTGRRGTSGPRPLRRGPVERSRHGGARCRPRHGPPFRGEGRRPRPRAHHQGSRPARSGAHHHWSAGPVAPSGGPQRPWAPRGPLLEPPGVVHLCRHRRRGPPARQGVGPAGAARRRALLHVERDRRADVPLPGRSATGQGNTRQATTRSPAPSAGGRCRRGLAGRPGLTGGLSRHGHRRRPRRARRRG